MDKEKKLINVKEYILDKFGTMENFQEWLKNKVSLYEKSGLSTFPNPSGHNDEDSEVRHVVLSLNDPDIEKDKRQREDCLSLKPLPGASLDYSVIQPMITSPWDLDPAFSLVRTPGNIPIGDGFFIVNESDILIEYGLDVLK